MPSSNISPAEHTVRHLRAQAADCRELGSLLYGGLLDHTAADLEAGGPAAVLLADHLADRAPGLLALRLLGGVHAQVLSRHAPELAMYYPSVGGTADPGPDADLAWPAFRALLHDHEATLRPWLGRAPQTNEIGRGVALVGALRHLVAAADLPIRLVEVGASAGLNLRADLAHITGAGTTHGDPASPAQLLDAWQGGPLPATAPRIVERTGGDLHPIDATTTEGRLTLTAYVWADQAERIERLRGGLALAGQVSVDLHAEPASATLGRVAVTPGHWTVLWHSIFRQYLSDAEHDAMTAAIGAIADTATDEARFAHVFLEPADRSGSGDVEVVLTTWPAGRRQLLGVAAAHGIPTTWLRQPRLQAEEVS